MDSSDSFLRSRSARWRVVLGGVVCAGLVAGLASPSWAAADEGGRAGSAVIGPFALGAGAQGAVDERSGSFSFDVPLGGVSLKWDSRGASEGRFGFGPRWALDGIGHIDTEGGVRVVPSSGVQGVFDADASVPSGLAGYPGDDVRFAQTPGVLPARADGVLGERDYAFVLRELGGLVSYFDAAGDPVAKLDAHGARVDWEWQPAHRLARVVTETGVVTELDWSDPARVEIEARAGADGPVRPAGVIELDAGRVIAIVDATGARTTVSYAPTGLVSRIAAPSGAATQVVWQPLPDGTAAVERVAVTDPATGELVTERRWEATAGLASGWPATGGTGAVGEGHVTAMTDGLNRVESEYDGRQAMTARETSVTTASGEQVLQQQAFTYQDGGAPGRADRPNGMDLTHTNAAGATKTVSEAYLFDAYGRVVERTTVDGTVTKTEYDPEPAADPELPDDLRVPVGLPISQRTEAPDGAVTETRYTLNDARTAVTVEETFAGASGSGLTRTGRSEFVVGPDGFVSVERVYPQGGAGEPLVTEHTKTIDLAAGTVTTTETVGAGTELATTTSTVADLVHGKPTTVTDLLGNTTMVSYDPVGRPVEVVDRAGGVTRTEYPIRQDGGVNATITTRPDRVVRTEEQDVIGRQIRLLDNIADGVAAEGYARVAETREYPSPNSVRVTDAWGWQTTTEQDAFGRVMSATVSSGVSQVVEYDEVAGTKSAGTTMTGDLADAELVTTQHVDANGRLTGMSGIRADGLPVAETVAEYDGFGRQTRSSDGTADAAVSYDVHGNPITTTIEPDEAVAADPGGGVGDPLVATRRFDAQGVSVEKTLTAAGESRTGGLWEFDLLGRERTVTDQAGGLTSYEYTPDGLIAEQATRAGTVTVNTYDPTTRRLTETVTTSPVGDPVGTGYEYDEATGRVVEVFDPADREATTARYAYDAWGNVTEIAYPDGETIGHEYDEHGRKTRTTDAAGATTEFQHQASGLLIGAIQYDADGDEIASVAYTYDDYARVTGIDRGNGVHTEVTFTSASEIASETTTGPDHAVQSARVYAYDATGNLTTRTDTVTDPGTQEPTTTTTAYEYDLHHRLVGSAVHDGDTTDGAVRSQAAYTLNVSGDVTREHLTTEPGSPGQAVQTRDLEYSPTGQLTRITITHPDGQVETAVQEYDAAGNLTLAADGTRYAYNALNQPVHETTPEGAVTHTGYWATGDRASLATGEQTTGFYWDDGTLLNDTHTAAGATQTASYLTGIARESRTLTGDTTRYAVHDRHGNTTELTDSAGGQTTRYAYTDYGTTTIHAAGEPGAGEPGAAEASRYPFLYSGEYTNPTGTQHLAVRTYVPDRMSFTTQDTLPLQNRYGYANANPITHFDPSGHFAVHDVVHGLSTGLSVMFAVLLGVSIYATGGLAAMSVPAIVAATGFFLVDSAAAVIGTIGLVHTYGPKFLQPEDEEPLEYAEYGLLAAGAAGMFFRVAPKVAAKVMGAWNELKAAKRAHDDQLLLNANHEIAMFHRGRQKMVTDVNTTEFVKNLHESTTQIRPLLNRAQESLDRIKTAYLDVARGWRGGTPTNVELDSFVFKHRVDFNAVDDALTRARWRVGSELPNATDAQRAAYGNALELSEYLHTPRINSLLESTRFTST